MGFDEQHPLVFELDVIPRTKKTSNIVAHLGKPCRLCHRGLTSVVLPSDLFQEFEAAAVPKLRRMWYAVEPRKECCPRCEGSGKYQSRTCIGCAGTGSRAAAWSGAVHVRASFFCERDAGDLLGYEQALADVLEVAGVVKNDRQIISWDGSRLYKDKDRPRTELEMRVYRERSAQLSLEDI